MRGNIIKKGISSFLCLAMLFQTSALVANAENTETEYAGKNKISDDILSQQIEYAMVNTSSGEEGTPDIDQEEYVDFQVNTKPSYIPTKYDLRDKQCVTSVKDQGEEGLCWAFSTLGSAESNILKQGLACPDEWKTDGELSLSVEHLAWFPFTTDERRDELSVGDYIETEKKGLAGGNSSIAVAALASGIGAQITNASTKQSDGSYSEYERYSSLYRLNSSQFISKIESSEDINSVKQMIMDNGAVDVSFYYDSSFYTYNSNNTAYYQGIYSDANTNHEVSIVGWDDDFEISNFNSKGGAPSKPGAWLIKNSWGTEKNDGYIWISYYEPSLASFTQFIMESASESDNIIQYDTSVCVNAYSFESTANVFKAESSQSLKSIGFYIFNDLSTSIFVDAKIYILDDDFDSPVDGTLVREIKGTYTNTGYKQAEISNSLILEKGQRYSVVLSYKYGSSSGKSAYSPIEENSSSQWYDFNYTSNPKESYVIDNGKWVDAYYYSGKYGAFGNVPIKAYTDNISENELTSANTKLSEAIDLLKSSDENYSSTNVYKQAVLVENTTEFSDSVVMLNTATGNIYSYLEKVGAVSYPENAIKEIILGDLNKDGGVDSNDAVIILKSYAAKIANIDFFLTYSEEKYGDVNGDGSIDSNDAVICLQYYATIIAGIDTGSVEEFLKKRTGS